MAATGGHDSDYLQNRVARLTFDLKTAEAQIEGSEKESRRILR